MSDNLRDYLNEFLVVYFDDNDLDTHWKHVRKALERLRERKLTWKIKACEFAVEKRITSDILLMQKQRCNTRNLRMASAENVKEFRGIAGYYRQYIKQFSDKMKPLIH